MYGWLSMVLKHNKTSFSFIYLACSYLVFIFATLKVTSLNSWKPGRKVEYNTVLEVLGVFKRIYLEMPLMKSRDTLHLYLGPVSRSSWPTEVNSCSVTSDVI